MQFKNIFYVGYNTLTGEVIPDTMYKHWADTNDYLNSLYGTDWKNTKDYLEIKKCEVLVYES